jgi:hypothetical protein
VVDACGGERCGLVIRRDDDLQPHAHGGVLGELVLGLGK